eukprot:TRINITY_DN16889_c0_g1_i1.p1 TRINITY_DN16889_c0_g1~~TRINITY_DN16889_c0_g1_i1.p1  ORF type:complete len:323 (-),score=42.87 TRINITY_DN16889_c0_g1_i1:225-1193(-)
MPRVGVVFELRYAETFPGQSIRVTGAHEALGEWKRCEERNSPLELKTEVCTYPSWEMLGPVWLDLPEAESVLLEYKYVRHPGPWAESGQHIIWEDKIKNRCVVLPAKPGIWRVSDAHWNDNQPSQVDQISLNDLLARTTRLDTELFKRSPGTVPEGTVEQVASIQGFCSRLAAKAGKDPDRLSFFKGVNKDACLRRLPTPAKAPASARPSLSSTCRVPVPVARRESNVSTRSQRSERVGRIMECLAGGFEVSVGAKKRNSAAAKTDFGALVSPNRSSWEWPLSKGEKHLRLHMIDQHVASLDRKVHLDALVNEQRASRGQMY